MQDYVVCERRGNYPRIHIKICEQRCEFTETCEAFQEYFRTRTPAGMMVSAGTAERAPDELATPAVS